MLTIDEVKAWLGVKVDTYDAMLTELETRAVAIIERELRWYFGSPRQVTEVLNGTGTPMMFLHQPPDDGVVALSYRTGPGAAWSSVTASNFEIDGRGLYTASGNVWYKGLRNYRAVYLEGFTTPPEDVKQLVYDLVAAIWKRRGSEGLASESIGDYSYSIGDLEALPRWSKIKNAWKRGRI